MKTKIDKICAYALYYIFNCIYYISLQSRELADDYLYKMHYKQDFEEKISQKNMVYFAMIIDKDMTWTQIHDKIEQNTRGKNACGIDLKRRICYKIRDYARTL